MSQSRNIAYFDTMRAIATLSVIIIHVSTPVVKMSYGNDIPSWWVGNIIDSAVRFCVPLFLLLSGTTLLSKDYKLGEFYRKRFMRVLLPFLFWAAAYLVYSWLIIKQSQRPYGFEAIKNWAIKLYVEKGISLHFWFIYMLLVLYLFIPFLGRGLRKLQDKVIFYILLAWFVLNLLLMIYVIKLDNFPFIAKAFNYFRFAGYLVLGYYLSKKDFSQLKMKLLGWGFFIGSVLFVSIYTYFISKSDHKLNLFMYNYLSINTIIQTIAVFMIVSGSEIKNKILIFLRDTISNYSFGIYLVHIMVIGVLFLNKIFWTMAPPIVSVPLITLLVLIISTGIIYLLRKIPGGKYISG